MIQTSYVPLEHPYQIVEYQGTLGIQIGTLIVTVDKSEDTAIEYSIETHSHPVVSYVNNKLHTDLKRHRSLTMPRPYEGVVWDKVEVWQLRSLVRENESFSWSDYMDLCCRWRLSELEGLQQNVDATIMDNYGILMDWGIDIDLPKGVSGINRTLLLEVNDYVRYGEDEYLLIEGDMGIVVKKNDTIFMEGQVFGQVDFFLSFLEYIDIKDCKVKFWTENLFMIDLTEDLNKRWAIYKQASQDDENLDFSRVAEEPSETYEDE